MKHAPRLFVLLASACLVVFTLANFAQAQRVDFAFGVSTLTAPSASDARGDHAPMSLTGGAYPGFSADVLILGHLGVGGEVYWKASQGNYLNSGVGFRPFIYDVNAVYAPKIAPHVNLEIDAGIGALSTRFYTGTTCGPFGCVNYTDSNHFMGDFGGGLKIYGRGGFFIRPEARFYLVNNNVEFSSSHFTRFGASIGYTFGGR